jgi:hypothetical protein
MKKNLLVLSLLTFGISFSVLAQTQTTVTTSFTRQNNDWAPKVIVIASYGKSFKLAKTAAGLNNELKNAVTDLKSGNSFDLNAFVVLRNKRSAVGLKYNQFQSNTSSFTYKVDEKNTFIGPAFLFCPKGNEVGQGNLEVAAGYMGYKQNWIIAGEVPFELTGSTFGLSAGGGYHFKITKNVLVGPQVNFLVGTIRKFDQNFADGTKTSFTLEENNAEGLHRIDLSISAKIRL